MHNACTKCMYPQQNTTLQFHENSERRNLLSKSHIREAIIRPKRKCQDWWAAFSGAIGDNDFLTN